MRIIILLLLLVWGGKNAMACPFRDRLCADISKPEIVTNKDFKGDKITVFGNKNPKAKIIAILKGQKINLVAYRKDSVYGIWVNKDRRIFNNVNKFYYIVAQGEISSFGIENSLKQYEIGLENMTVKTTHTDTASSIDIFDYRAALIEDMKDHELYKETYTIDKSSLNSALFSFTFDVPANIPIGNYTVQVFSILGGNIIDVSVIPLKIRQSGIIYLLNKILVENRLLYFIMAMGISIILSIVSMFLTKIVKK